MVPDCRSCSGMMKPDVVFFGETVPRDRVAFGIVGDEILKADRRRAFPTSVGNSTFRPGIICRRPW
ncbi:MULTISPECIES: Sir2 family NAD-dependent protein deacetylase [unclassified Bradyrhizobium]|uniref:Sir2 family NAD-dependent protein deacetylase n=1 Tax=unclassified Bradyrhizobium TaxID=2631580 RepID=UPI0039647EC0